MKKEAIYINVLVYPELSVTEEMSLSCRSTSWSCGPTVSPKLSVPLNAFFFSFLCKFISTVRRFLKLLSNFSGDQIKAETYTC